MRMKTEDLITDIDILTKVEVENLISLNEQFTFYVYFLIDPYSLEVRYIGKGSGNRCTDHIDLCEEEVGRKATWLRKLKRLGEEPLYVIWEFYGTELTEDDVYKEEFNLIKAFGRKGIDNKGTLYNIANSKGGNLKTTEQFIKEAELVHGNKFDYSQVVYKGTNYPIECKCNSCGYINYPKPYSHLEGKGCKGCHNRLLADNTSIFIRKALTVHKKGDYDYSKVKYINNVTKVPIICNKCGTEFLQAPVKHRAGQGCPNRCYKTNLGRPKINKRIYDENNS